MSLRNQLKAALPPSWWMFAGFCKRLPAYWRMDRSESLRFRNSINGLALYLTPDIYVEIPENLSAYLNWNSHALTDPSSSRELRDFLALSEGKKAFIDIGAQTGFLSAVFSRMAQGPTRIASLEPDPQVHQILLEAHDFNVATDVDWQIIHAAVSDINGTLFMPVSNTVFDKMSPNRKFGEIIPVTSTRLDDLIKTLGWEPDIIKIDVESYEHEILNSSWDLFERIRPALQLELHWQLLKARGLNGIPTMEHLYDLGYRGTARKNFGIDQWKKLSTREDVSRIPLQQS